jgi:thioredoxin-related protein
MLILFFISLSHLGFSQSDSNQWSSNLEEASLDAQEKDKDILMVFAGSDWCKPCMKFKKDILEDAEFESFASENLTILYLDFPARKKNKLPKEQTQYNENLAEKYNTSGSFPKVILFNSIIEKQREIEYTGQDAASFISQIRG